MACSADEESHESVDFNQCHQSLVEWLNLETNEEWQLLCSVQDEKRFVIKHQTKNVTFDVTMVSQDGQQYFRATSYDSRIQSHLNTSKMSSIQECMQSATAALQNLLVCQEGKGEDDGGVDDEDYDDDDEDDITTEQYYEGIDDYSMEEIPNRREEAPAASLNPLCHSTAWSMQVAARRLHSDLVVFKRSNGCFGVHGCPRGDDNLFLWDAQLTDFDPSSTLAQQLASYARTYNQKPEIQLEMKFPTDYPMSPPFIRVIRPRFEFLTGHITVGGSICMELLTKSGWKPVFEIESILVQVRAAILSDPNARLDLSKANQEYNEAEAEAAFKRMVQNYGWD